MNWLYGVRIAREAGDYVVSVRDLPEVVTSGDTEAEALELAADAIDVVIAGRMKDGSELGAPSAVLAEEYAVAPDPHLAAKATVYTLWKASNVSKVELARRMDRHETEVRRVLDPDHGTKLDLLQEAAKALGRKLLVGYV